MRYEDLKKFDLNSVKSEDDATKWKDTVMASDKTDILMYVNFLRWQQFNNADIKYMNRIVHFLSFDELIDFERENTSIITGDTEDLVLLAETPKEEEKLVNPVYIDGVEYSVKSVLEDDFESIMIVSDRENMLYKFGFIVLSTLQGLELYAYELFEESQEYYKQILDAKVGTKINVYCDIVGENQVTKTFKKSDLLIEEKSFVLAKKTNKGVMSPVTKEGTFTILKKEDVMSADGISEDRLQNQISKYQQEIAAKLGIKQSDIDNATKKPNDDCDCDDDCDGGSCGSSCAKKKKKYTKEDFVDNFKFSKKYHFSVLSPGDIEEYSHVNPLTHTVLEFNTDEKDENGRYYISVQFVEEVYQLLFNMFGIVEDMEGLWSIENTKLDRVMRKLVQAGAEVEIIEEDASDFLMRFIRQKKFDRILNPNMRLDVLKTIRTKKEIEEFAKDSGTELYLQLGQPMTVVLEGTQRLYGEGHMVFDSDHKLIICKYDKIDLYEASEYAIDNGYDNFYVIEKDKYQQYDAWYKETLKNKVEDEPTEQKPEKTESKGFEPVVDEETTVDEETIEAIEDLWPNDGDDDEDDVDEDDDSQKYANDEFLFGIYTDSTASNELGEPQVAISITPKSYWDKNKCQYDQHTERILRKKYPYIKNMGDTLEELCECEYAMNDGQHYSIAKHLNYNDTITHLCKSGLKFSESFQTWISKKDAQTVKNDIIQMGYQNIII